MPSAEHKPQSRPRLGHLDFIGGTIYCPRRQRRYNLRLEHRIYSEYVCPGCGVRIPAKERVGA